MVAWRQTCRHDVGYIGKRRAGAVTRMPDAPAAVQPGAQSIAARRIVPARPRAGSVPVSKVPAVIIDDQRRFRGRHRPFSRGGGNRQSAPSPNLADAMGHQIVPESSVPRYKIRFVKRQELSTL